MAFSDPQKNIEQLELREGMVVADFGAGSGAYTIAAAKSVGDSGHVYAVDVQKELLSGIKNLAAKEGVFNIEVIWGDIERIGKTKIKDGIIDVVIISNILFQVEDKIGLLNEAMRILKKTGIVLVVDWVDSFGGLGPDRDQIISHSEAKKLFEENNFSFIKNISAGDHHWGFVMEKYGNSIDT